MKTVTRTVMRDGQPLFKMYTSNEVEEWRYSTALTKEPETLAWIDSFSGGWFYDVGANIGLYSLYAASRGMRVIAFEPVTENHYRLAQNIRLNNANVYLPVPTALSDQHFTMPRVYSFTVGSSGWQVPDARPPDECSSLCLAVETIDRMWSEYGFPPPSYIKIDVDGKEGRVLKGMAQTLGRKILKSVLIEINNERDWIVETFKKNGFSMDNPFNCHEPHSRSRRTQEGIGCENVVFTR